ncbi:MAG: hydroxymethylbilane synthase [Deltaproteobacteria bacterium]|nr:hydroxymethylbilane synthase [Deltaproteobacteria bacterium]
MSTTVRIATRKSPLALWQAEHVAERLQALEPGLQAELVKLTTQGDKILDQALSKVGGKDLFVKEIEMALLDGRAEVAVHSLKDVPTDLPAGLSIRAFPPREDPRDALVSLKGYTMADLPKGAKVGTSSLRRAAQLLRRRPDVQIVPIRGNVQTRLRKLEEEGMDATLLAYAGLLRLEMADVATEVLDPSVSLPAIGQGILAVETKDEDEATNRRVSALDDAGARAAALMERAFLRKLQGGCQVPIAGHATVDGDRIQMRGLVAALDGSLVYEDEAAGPVGDAVALGTALADRLLAAGANRILDALKAEAGGPQA